MNVALGNVFRLTLALLLGVAAGYRAFGPGRDFLDYQAVYDTLTIDSYIGYFRFEPGFLFAAAFSKIALGLTYSQFVTVCVAAVLYLKFNLLKRYPNPALTTAFYLACWYPLHEYTQLRAAIASTFLLLAADAILQSRWLRFATFVCIAFSFHFASLFLALVILIALVLSRYEWWIGIPVTILTLSSVPIFAYFMLPYLLTLNPLIDSYLLRGFEFATPNLLAVGNALTTLFIILFCALGVADTRERRFFLLIAAASIIIFVYLLESPVIAHRLKEATLVLSTPLAFNFALTHRNVPLLVTSVLIASWGIYTSVAGGLFSG